MDTSKARGPGQNKRFWNEDEDKCLIDSLIELHNEGEFKAEGNFKPGHLQALEKKLHSRFLPGCQLLSKPHIESRMKTLKTHFQIVHEMLTGPNCSGFGWDPDRKTVTAEKPVWEAYLKSHKEATTFKTEAFPYYEDLCMVFGKDRATGKNAETPADVVEDIDKEGGDDINLDDDTFTQCIRDMNTCVDEAQSMPFSQASGIPQAHSQAQGSSKKKQKSVNKEEAYEALKESSLVLATVIEKAFARLSRAIGEEIMEKHSRLGEELQRTTTVSTMERHKAARMIMKDDAMVSYFFSVPDEERDEWVRALLAGDI